MTHHKTLLAALACAAFSANLFADTTIIKAERMFDAESGKITGPATVVVTDTHQARYPTARISTHSSGWGLRILSASALAARFEKIWRRAISSSWTSSSIAHSHDLIVLW